MQISDYKFISAPTTESLTYGYKYTGDDLLYLDGIAVSNFPFGQSENDALELTVMSSDGATLLTSTVTSSLNYTPFTRSYIDVNNRGHTYNYRTFQSDFVVVGSETRSLFVDAAAMLTDLGLSQGVYKVGLEAVRYRVSSPFDPARMLMVREVSPSGTEISVSPMPLATSTDPLDVDVNQSFNSFMEQSFWTKQVIQPLLSGIENPSLYDAYYKAYSMDSGSAEMAKFYYSFKGDVDWESTISGSKSIQNIDSKKSDLAVINFITDIYYGVRKSSLRSDGQLSSHDIYGIFDQFKNTLFENYESITSFSEIKDFYYSLVSYILDKELNQITNKRPEHYDDIARFFGRILYDITFLPTVIKLETEWDQYFNGHLKNEARFADGTSVPILNYTRSVRSDPSGHNLLLLKFCDPIPKTVTVGSKLWITNLMPSDTVIQSVYLYEKVDTRTVRLAGPNFLTQIENVGNGTQELSLESVISATGSLYDEVYSKMIAKANQPTTVNVDYRYFENFVRFSSAENRLYVFSTKVSEIQSIESAIADIQIKLGINPNDEQYVKELNDLNVRFDEIEASMDGYELFLYNNPTWYEAHIKTFNGVSSASLYDQDNLSSLANNLPAYIRENDQNNEYLMFVNMIGHFFDNIGGYIDQLTQKNDPTNTSTSGISNDVVYYMLESLGWEPEIGRENLPLLLSSFSKDDFEVSSSLWNLVGSMSEDDRNKTIWKRILNNLPYILKTKGTTSAISALVNCYGVPKNLIQVKEYGGIQLDPNVEQDSLYIFDETKYSVTFKGVGEYLNVPWTGSVRTVEFNFSFDPTKTSEDGSVFRLVNGDDNWVIGCVRESGKDWGRVFFSIQDESGSVITSTTARTPVFTGDTFSVMLRRMDVHPDFLIDPSASVTTTDLYPQVYNLTVQRNDDARATYAVSASVLLSGSFNSQWRTGSAVYFGNYQQMTSSLGVDPEAFFGTLDEIKLWETPLDPDKFDDHASYHGAYNGSMPSDVVDKILVRASFLYPIDLFSTSSVVSVENMANRESFPTFSAVNFQQSTGSVNYDPECGTMTCKVGFPYQFKAYDTHQYVSLPNFGSNKFKSNKVVEKSQVLVSSLSSDGRSTMTSVEDGTVDTNKLGVFVSPTDQINTDILKFFGRFEFGDLVGSPQDVYAKTYKNFEQFRRLYFDQGGGQIDYSAFLNMVRAYFDKSLFKYVKNLVPARAKLISGVMIEPTILERPKIQQKPIQQEVHRNLSTGITMTDGRLSGSVFPRLSQSLDIKTTGLALYDDYNRSFYADQLDPYGFGVFADNGIAYYNGDYWRADIIPVNRKIIVECDKRKPVASVSNYESINADNGRYQIVSRSFEAVNLSRFPLLYQYPTTPTMVLHTVDVNVPTQRTEFNFSGSITCQDGFIGFTDPGTYIGNSTYVYNTTAWTWYPPMLIDGVISTAPTVLSGSLSGRIVGGIGLRGLIPSPAIVHLSGSYNASSFMFVGRVIVDTTSPLQCAFYTIDPSETIFDTFRSNAIGDLFGSIDDSSYAYRLAISLQNIPAGSRPLNGYYRTHYRYKKPMFSRSMVHVPSVNGAMYFRKGLQTQQTTVQENGLMDNSPPVVITKTS